MKLKLSPLFTLDPNFSVFIVMAKPLVKLNSAKSTNGLAVENALRTKFTRNKGF
jgi:hypothetical protein